MVKKSFLLILLSVYFICLSQKNDKINMAKIDTTEVIPIGGIKQFISIKGNNKEKPILLFLHGGPGTSLVAVSEKFTDKLKLGPERNRRNIKTKFNATGSDS